jgi:hypothetical protein
VATPGGIPVEAGDPVYIAVFTLFQGVLWVNPHRSEVLGETACQLLKSLLKRPLSVGSGGMNIPTTWVIATYGALGVQVGLAAGRRGRETVEAKTEILTRFGHLGAQSWVRNLVRSLRERT